MHVFRPPHVFSTSRRPCYLSCYNFETQVTIITQKKAIDLDIRVNCTFNIFCYATSLCHPPYRGVPSCSVDRNSTATFDTDRRISQPRIL